MITALGISSGPVTDPLETDRGTAYAYEFLIGTLLLIALLRDYRVDFPGVEIMLSSFLLIGSVARFGGAGIVSMDSMFF